MRIPDEVTYEQIHQIIQGVTENYDVPVPIGGRCESYVYYRLENLQEDEIAMCAKYVLQRLENALEINDIGLFLKLKGAITSFAECLYALFCEIYNLEPKFELYSENLLLNGKADILRNKTAILISDVITTAKSSLEAHSQATLRGIKIAAWIALIDRTFGPGPVPVIAAYTGAPVSVLTKVG